MKKKRGLNDDDMGQWQKVTQTVRPMHPLKPIVAQRASKTPSPAKQQVVAKPYSAPKQPVMQAISSPSSKLEAKTFRRIGRDSDRIDGTLDLHGMRQEEAHAALIRFITMSVDRGRKLVIIVTGKGRSVNSDGVLKRMVPQWLTLPPLSTYVVASSPAHRHRGGEGALYVQLRRKERLRG